MQDKKELTKWDKLRICLLELKVSTSEFTGKIEINIRNGGVSTVTRIENLK